MAISLGPSPSLPLAEATVEVTETNCTIKDPTSAIGSLKFCTRLQEIKQIHGHSVRTGLTKDAPLVVSKLIAAYAKVATPESLEYAKNFFKLLDENKPNIFMWNSLIRGYLSMNSFEEAIHVFVEMLNWGGVPDRWTYPLLFAGCTKILAFEEGRQVHGFLLRVGSLGGVESDVFTQNSLIHFYSTVGEMDSAQLVFDGMRERNVVSWTSLISGYARGNYPERAVSLFGGMKTSGVRPNSVTMACVVSACAKLKDLNLGKSVSAYISERGIELSVILVNSLVDMCMKCGSVESAEKIFNECSDRNVVLWNTMVSNYARLEMPRQALMVFNEMLVWGTKPDRVTIVAAVTASAQLGELVAGRKLHGYIIRNGLDSWDAVSNSVIDLYMKCGEPDVATKVFDQMSNRTSVSWNTIIAGQIKNGDLSSVLRIFEVMPVRDLVSWNTVIGALVQESRFEEAIALFRTMQVSDLMPDRVTMVSVASACGHLGALDLAKWVFLYIHKKNILRDLKLCTALVDMFARCGDSKMSMQVFHTMPVRDISAWTTAIGVMAIEGNGKGALDLFAKMIELGKKPDDMVFVQVLTACSHSGLVEEGLHIFQSMDEDYGVSPQLFHYGCVVDMLGRAGRLNDALSLIKSMPVEPNDVVWGALLGASRLHNNLELAEYAAKQVLALAPERSGLSVLLSNVYAFAGRWEDVQKVRLSLKDKGVQKLTGSSLMEVDGVIHEFTSGDESHSHMP